MAKHCENCHNEYADNLTSCPYCTTKAMEHDKAGAVDEDNIWDLVDQAAAPGEPSESAAAYDTVPMDVSPVVKPTPPAGRIVKGSWVTPTFCMISL